MGATQMRPIHRCALFFVIALITSSAAAVTYQKLDGSVVTLQYRSDYSWIDPVYVGDHLYPGDDLGPNAIIDASWNSYEALGDTLYAAFLQDADLRGVTTDPAWFGLADLRGANLSNADLSECGFPSADLANADFTGANLTEAFLETSTTRGSATNVNFTDANLTDSVIKLHDLSGTLFTNADLSGAILGYSSITHAQLQAAGNLNGVDFKGTDQSEMDFYGLDLSNAKFHSTHHQMVLSEADFSSSVLTGADFSGAWLSLADFSGADLSGSILTDSIDFNTATWTDAFYYTDNEPTWASGMGAAWRSSVGILALAPPAVPEPAAMLLAILGLALLPRRRRRRRR